jgi:LmbE family N-acetylglucosaminyl deacetylase
MAGQLAAPGRALAIGAHPDDVEFGCGGTLAKWASAGTTVDLMICTDGSKGSWDAGADLGELVATRRVEARKAADALGVRGEVVFLDWVDGEVEPTRGAVEVVTREIRRLRPDVLFTHDPWKRYRLHPDHRNVGWIVLDAVVAARDPHFFPEQDLAPHRPGHLLLFEADEPDHLEDVTSSIDAKLAALLEHRSQYESTMAIADPSDAAQVDAFRQEVLSRLVRTDRGHAEAFKAMTA